MRFMAQFDISADATASDDVGPQAIEHPNGDFKFTIRRKTPSESDGTATLHCNMEFEAAALDQAQDALLGYVRKVLDILALLTHASINFDRVHKIFEWTPGKVMRQGLLFVYDPPEPDPPPTITPDVIDIASLFLKADVGEKIHSAMHWFRLGASAESPEDQFQNFWFALELLAVHEKPTEQVHDSCPKCHGALFCETCGDYPKHAPYPKQAIAHLCVQLAPQDPEFFPIAEKARHLMMHGSSRERIEEKIGQPLPNIIDPLGQLVWIGLLNILVRGLPEEDRPTELRTGMATTFVKWVKSATAHIETVVPPGPDGEPDIELMTGITAEFT